MDRTVDVTIPVEPEAAALADARNREAVARLGAEIIRRALVLAGGNRARAAERLAIRRQLLYDKIARYGLDESVKRTDGVPQEDSKE